jgi:nucleotide-binding universal stress UspA family protein
MRRLLVAFDGSEPAKRALQHAIEIAKQEPPTELCIVRAYEPPAVRDEDVNAVLDASSHAEEYLSPALEIARTAGVTFVSEVLIGDIAKALVDHARRKGCQAIVMGTRGMGAVGNLLLGSTATKVLHLSSVPVTLIK